MRGKLNHIIKRPPSLTCGDTIGIVSPAGVVQKEKIEQGVRVLIDMGFNVKLGRNIFAKHNYLAGSDIDRAMDINLMFNDPEIKAIICSRGGYGSLRILHYIDHNIIKDNPKYLIGYSDITSLHLLLNLRLNLISLHGPMIGIDFIRDNICNDTVQYFKKILMGEEKVIQYNLNELDINIVKHGNGIGEGILVGGCISIICSTIGVLDELLFKDKLLFLEDVDEKLYRLDRMLSQLRLAGIIEGVKGIIFGKMEGCFVDEGEDGFNSLLDDILGDINIPILYGFPSGHGKTNITLPLGAYARIDTRDNVFKVTL